MAQARQDEIDDIIAGRAPDAQAAPGDEIDSIISGGTKATRATPSPSPSMFGEERLGPVIGALSWAERKMNKPIEVAQEFYGHKLDAAARAGAERLQPSPEFAAKFPKLSQSLAAQGALATGVPAEAAKIALDVVIDPKNWPLLLMGGPAVRPVIARSASALFTVMQETGAIEALLAGDLRNAALLQGFALLGLKGVAEPVKARIVEEAGRQAREVAPPTREVAPPARVAEAPPPVPPTARVAPEGVESRQAAPRRVRKPKVAPEPPPPPSVTPPPERVAGPPIVGEPVTPRMVTEAQFELRVDELMQPTTLPNGKQMAGKTRQQALADIGGGAVAWMDMPLSEFAELQSWARRRFKQEFPTKWQQMEEAHRPPPPPPATTEPTPVSPERAAMVSDYFDKLMRNRVRSEAVKGAAERLAEDEVDPHTVLAEFWEHTFPALDAKGQRQFERQIKFQMGFEPGDTIGVSADKAPIVAGSWREVTELGLPRSAANLEQNEQAIVGLAHILNEMRRSQIAVPMLPTTRAEERQPPSVPRAAKTPGFYQTGKAIIASEMKVGTAERPLQWPERSAEVYFDEGSWFFRQKGGEYHRVTDPSTNNSIESAFKGGSLESPPPPRVERRSPENAHYRALGDTFRIRITQLSDELRKETDPVKRADIETAIAREESMLADVRTEAQSTSAGGEDVTMGMTLLPPDIIPPSFRRGPSVRAVDPQVERVLQATRQVDRVAAIKDWFGDRFSYEWAVRDFPELKNDLRLVKDSVVDSARRATEDITRVLGAPERPLSHREYEVFRRTVVLRDLAETGKRDLKLPEGVTLAQVEGELANLQAQASPAVRLAVARHDTLVRSTAEELVKRGKLPEDVLTKEAYYPHQVLDYSAKLDKNLPGMPARLRTPARMYTRKRVGSMRDIDTNYVEVMWRHLTKIRWDNALEDFAVRTAAKYDRSAMLDRNQQRNLFGTEGPQPGRLYTLPDGTVVKGWQLDPGNNAYRARTVNERILTQALAEEATVPEWLEMRGPKGGEPLRESTVMGSRRRVYLLEEPIAERLTRFREPHVPTILVDGLRSWVGFWKRLTLDYAGLPFQVNNFVGDLMNLYRADPAAFTKLPTAARMLMSESSETGRALRELAYQQRVVETSGIFGGEVLGRLARPETQPALRGMIGTKAYLKSLNPMMLIEEVSAYREGVPRLAKFLKDVERIQRGEQVVAGEADLTGLQPIDAAGKAAREFTVDYGATTPAFDREVRGLLMPFATFYIENAKNWGRYIARRPGDALIKFGIPLGMMWLWNNGSDGRRKVEQALPEWHRAIPHIVTGWTSKEGKPVIIGFQTPVDMAARMGGLDKFPMRVEQVRNGELTMAQAVEEQLKDTALAIPRMAENLANPLIKIGEGLLSNRDPFSGRAIVPERMKGTEQGRALQLRWALGQIFTPYGQYMRAEQMLDSDDTWAKMLRSGPLDIKRALGIREVNIEKEARSRQFQAIEKTTALYMSRLEDIEEKFVAWRAGTGDEQAYRDALTAARDTPGPKISRDALRARLTSPRVQAAILRAKLQQTEDERERRKLEEQISRLETYMLYRERQQVPRGARGSLPPPPPVRETQEVEREEE